jgi:hypothetical protein
MKFNYNKSKLFLISLLIALTLSSCLTKYFWDKKYKEIFRQFLVTQNGRQAVFIGEKYHYVFDDNSKLIANLLLWNVRHVLYIDLTKTYLKVDRNNHVSGYATIKTSKILLSRDFSYLQSLGFRQVSYGNLEIRLNLSGTRYLPRKGVKFYTYLLSQQYNLEIHTELDPEDKALAIAITPVTAAVDATLWIGNNILLAPFKN